MDGFTLSSVFLGLLIRKAGCCVHLLEEMDTTTGLISLVIVRRLHGRLVTLSQKSFDILLYASSIACLVNLVKT